MDNVETAHAVLRAIRRIVRRISQHSKHLAQVSGMTVPQLLCLKAIGELAETAPEVTAAMVGQRVHLSPATVTRILDRLEAVELIRRERRSKDRRKICLTLTRTGRERFASLPTPLQDSFVQRLMELGERERRTLLRALDRITVLMEADRLDAAPLLTPGAEVSS